MGEGCICGDGKKEAHVRKRHKVTQGCLRGQGNNGQDAGYIGAEFRQKVSGCRALGHKGASDGF